MTFLKNHWFGLIVSGIVGAYFVVFLLAAFAPRHDVRQRGFSKCSTALTEAAVQCGSGFSFCLLKAVAGHGLCHAEVVWQGVVFWLQGKQSTPWANYFFETENVDEELLKIYEENPELAKGVSHMTKKYRELESKVLDNE